MARGLKRNLPAALLVLVGIAIVVWSGAAIYEEITPFEDQDSYDAAEAERLDGRVYEFEELSPGAQNLTVVALQDEITTRSPVPPEFAIGDSDEPVRESPDQMGHVVDYYVRYRDEFHRLGISTNESAVTVVEISGGPGEDFFAYSSLTDRERTVVDRAIGSNSTINGPDADELPHLDAKPIVDRGQYVVYKDGQPYDLSVEQGTGPRWWLLILVPAFLLGVLAAGIGAIGYWLSATAVPMAVLLGYVTLFGPSVLTELGIIAPMEEPLHLLGVAPLVTAVTMVVLGIHRSLRRSTG